LKLHQFFNDVARTFSYTQAWVSEGSRNLKISAKKAVFSVSIPNFTTFAPPEKHLEKSTSAPPGKNPSNGHAHKHAKLHHYCKTLCCIITPSGNTVQEHLAASKP